MSIKEVSSEYWKLNKLTKEQLIAIVLDKDAYLRTIATSGGTLQSVKELAERALKI